jgi:hypothetical protein
MPSEADAVSAAADAAADVIFSRLDRSDVEDYDVSVRYADGELDVDVYLLAPDAGDVSRVVDDAALAAREAADRVLREEE